jgi:hypothetical protein
MKNQTVSVVIPCHNYAHYLGECLQSVIGQTHVPCEIIVVDDDSSDRPEEVVSRFDFENLRIIKVSNRNIARTQIAGISSSKGEYICCIDADDTISPFYIEDGLKKFSEDYRVGIVYSDFEYRGLMQGISYFPESSSAADVYRNNFIHSGSLFRKQIALLTESFQHPDMGKYLVDWYTWKKILKEGYLAVKQKSKYVYRRHEGSDSSTHAWRYYEAAALSSEKISMVVLVDEMQHAWPAQERFLLEQHWPRDQVSLIVMTTNDSDSSMELRDKVLELPYDDIQFSVITLPCKTSAREKEHAIAARVAEEVEHPFFILIDEFVVPPVDVVKKLFEEVCENTIQVSTDFTRNSWNIISLKKRSRRKTRETKGIQLVGENLFLCCLIRSRYFKEAFMQTTIQNTDTRETAPEKHFNSITNGSFISKVNCNVISDYDYYENDVRNIIQSIEKNFDEEFYLAQHNDVREAVDKGEHKSGFHHFSMYGLYEERDFRLTGNVFDENYYLKNYPDVHDAVKKGVYYSGHEHYIFAGKREGRCAIFY